MSESSIDELVYRSKLAEQAERFDEMKEYMKKVAEDKKTELAVEERNLLSVAYKNIVASRRSAWVTIYTLESKEKQKAEVLRAEGKVEEATKHEERCKFCKEYRAKIEHELTAICKDILHLLNNHLIPKANKDVAAAIPELLPSNQHYKDQPVELEQGLQKQLAKFEEQHHFISKITNGESLVLYFKMLGDYYRYLAEFNVEREVERLQACAAALTSYYISSEIAKVHLPPAHPIRLGLALNFSVFYYEIMSQPERACQLAKNAFDEAVAELDMLAKELYKDSTLILQLLRDNLMLWTSDMNDNANDTNNAEEGE